MSVLAKERARVIEITMTLEKNETRTATLANEGSVELELFGSSGTPMTAREAIALAKKLEWAADKLIEHLPKSAVASP